MGFEWDAELVPSVKLGLHSVQIVFAFVVFVLEIIVFRDSEARINGQNGWVFGLCFLSIPAWCYLIMAPRFSRTQRMAEPHAMTVIDAIWAVLWLSAFASQAAYNTANNCGGQCAVSKGIVGVSFFVFLFFILTTLVSFYSMKYYENNGNLPGYNRILMRSENIDPDKAAFSMAPHDDDAYAPVHMDEQDHDDAHRPYNADSYGSVGSRPMFMSDMEDTSYRPQNADAHDDPYNTSTAYGGISGAGGPRIYAPPTAEEHYDDNRPAQFPAGNYDRGMH